MTERLNTTATNGTSAAFSPAGEWAVQTAIDAASKAYVEVEIQVDAAAGWISIGALSARTAPPVLRFAKVPFARLRWYNNDGGYALKAWTAE